MIEMMQLPSAAFDFEGFVASFDGDEESANLVVQVFLATYSEDVRLLRDAGVKEDAVLLRQVVRHLSDSLSYFGDIPALEEARHLGRVLQSLEPLATRRLTQDLCASIEAFAVELDCLSRTGPV